MANLDGTVSESVDEPLCAKCEVNSVIPGTDWCGDCTNAYPSGGSPNGGLDGSLSDGTAIGGSDPVNGYQDGTLREEKMTPEEIRLSAYLAEIREKYTSEEIETLGKQGHALRNLDGTYSFPIVDQDDADAATHAVARSGTEADAVRAFIVKRLGELVAEAQAETAGESAEEEEEDEVEAEAETVAEVEELSAAAQVERKERKPRHRSTPNPREEVRDSVVHFGLNDLKVTEVRSGLNGEITLEGTPIVYNRSYTVNDAWGAYRETMAPSVAESVLSSPLRLDCRFLINHDGIPLARTQSGTLELHNGPDGLTSVVHLDTRQTLSNDLAIAIERGDITQMSCGFIVGEDEWNDDMTQRTINRFSELLDVSAVTYPASPTTHIAIAQRMMQATPVESRARIREAFKMMNEIRAGRTFNSQNAQFIMSALESLHEADDLDPQGFADRAAALAGAHQRASDALGSLTGLELEPGADNADQANGGGDSVVEDPGESIRSEDETAELRRKSIIARRDRLARRRYTR